MCYMVTSYLGYLTMIVVCANRETMLTLVIEPACMQWQELTHKVDLLYSEGLYMYT